MSVAEKDVKTRLRNIVSRRNQIVHEADIDITTGFRLNIDVSDTIDTVNFIEKLGTSIFNSVK